MKVVEVLKRVKRRVEQELSHQYRSMQHTLSSTLYVSIGENCLTDHLLDRHGVKSFATVYSHGRSNLDYAIQLEEEQYGNLLNNDFLYYDQLGSTRVVRNSRYKVVDQIFDSTHTNGFEFTHHDIIGNETKRKSLERKLSRLNKYRGVKNFKFYYHYRLHNNLSLEALFKKAETFLKFYQTNGRECEFIIFTQSIVDSKDLRGVEKVMHSDKIRVYTFKTTEAWAGDDAGIFAAKHDDDLIVEMFK